jgi:GNAT superfamily N-acetyltransferase
MFRIERAKRMKRVFNDADVGNINEMLRQLSGRSKWWRTEEFNALMASANGPSELFIAIFTGDGRIVGMASAFVRTLTVGRTAVGVEDVVVEQVYRKHGIGDLLMAELHAFAIEKDAAFADLTSGNNRTPALRLYNRLGYEQPETNYLRRQFP